MNYTLVIIWESGEKQAFEYSTEDEAWKAGKGMKMALGNQIAWWCVECPTFYWGTKS